MEILDKIKAAIQDGPTFGTSEFQTNQFTLGQHAAPARAYRQVLLELSKGYEALKRASIKKERMEIELKILERDLESEKDELKRKLIELDIDEKTFDVEAQVKLFSDAINHCNHLYAQFEKMPKFTSEEFEAQEREYWKTRLIRKAQLSVLARGTIDEGTAEAMTQIELDPVTIQQELALHNRKLQLDFVEKQKLLAEQKGK